MAAAPRPNCARFSPVPCCPRAAREYATRMAKARRRGLSVGFADGAIGAIAAAAGCVVASRDVAPFEALGIRVIDPWSAD